MSTEYKKGDRVRRVNVGNGAYGARIGQEATVVSADSRMVYVDYAPRNPCSYAINEPEGWYRENVELIVEPSLKVGDKVAHRPTPDVLVGEVIAIWPNADHRQQLAVMRTDKKIRLRPLDGTLYATPSEEDYVPYVEPPKIEKVTRYVRPIAYGQVRDMLTFNTRSAAEQYVPVLPTDCKYALGEIKDIVLEVEVPSGK